MRDNIRLLHGDCLELMKTIPDGSVDLTITSPPYDKLRTYNGNIEQWNFEKFKGIAKELFRVTKQGGVVVWLLVMRPLKEAKQERHSSKHCSSRNVASICTIQ